MFSGKSTELARRIRRHKVANRQCLVVKYAGDTRYENEPGTETAGTAGSKTQRGRVITHDRQALVAVPCMRLADVGNIVHAFDVIGVDEGQFFPDVVEQCEKWANAGKTVIVAALDATFQRKPFNDVLSLVPLAEEVTKLSAVCAKCSADAAFTKRVNTDSQNVELIGGSDCYVAACRQCFDSKDFPAGPVSTQSVSAASIAKKSTRSARKRRSSAFGLSPGAVVEIAGAAKKETEDFSKSISSKDISTGTPSVTPADRSSISPSKVGEKMRSLALASPATPAMDFSGFGSPVTVAEEKPSKAQEHVPGTAKKKKALGLGAAAAAAAAEVMGTGRPARGAGGPGRSPIMDLASRGMGAVARSPLANVR
jgi:thymidine kinase